MFGFHLVSLSLPHQNRKRKRKNTKHLFLDALSLPHQKSKIFLDAPLVLAFDFFWMAQVDGAGAGTIAKLFLDRSLAVPCGGLGFLSNL